MLNHFNLYVHPCRKIQIGERLHETLVRVKDIDDPLMDPHLELLPAVLVYEGRPVDSILFELRGQRDRSENFRVSAFQNLHYLPTGIVY